MILSKGSLLPLASICLHRKDMSRMQPSIIYLCELVCTAWKTSADFVVRSEEVWRKTINGQLPWLLGCTWLG